MRVLIVPELYRPGDASANATLNDAVTWVRDWLRRDETIHVYWLLPHRGTAGYEREDVLADRDRVTLIEADHLMARDDRARLFTESGYTEDQLHAIERDIYDELGYVDIVVDQLRQGRADLKKWLLELSGNRADAPRPFDVIANVHDLLLPSKYPEDGRRADYHRQMEVVDAVLGDGAWFKARVDARELPAFASSFLPDDLVERAMDDAVMTDSPMDFGRFEERYRETPRWLHIAGSTWQKKRPELVMEIARDLHRRYGIRTVMTSMDDIPDEYADRPWVEAHPNASRDEYERTLRRGDIAICASEYDTLARTWFEQAASGQVLVVRDEEWVHDCVPDDSPLLAPVDELGERARWVVENWEDAVAANRRLNEHVREIRSPERAGRVTHADMADRVAERVDRFAEAAAADDSGDRAPIGRAIEQLDAETMSLAELNEAGARVTDDGEPLLDHDWCSLGDLVFALRERGFRDDGTAGTPVFGRRVGARTADGETRRTPAAPSARPSWLPVDGTGVTIELESSDDDERDDEGNGRL